MMNLQQSAIDAADRIDRFVCETPVVSSEWMSDKTGADVWFKCENLQHTGSFKFRGAVNKLLSLTVDERSNGVVAASTGNHGAAVARAMSLLQTPGIIFVPENAIPTKLESIRGYGAEIRKEGDDCVIAEAAARVYSAENEMAYISPYNDPDVVAGQGTVGIELRNRLPDLNAVFVSLGGGGLISGIAGALKSENGKATIIACSPENSPVMHKSVEAGRILQLDSKPTLSDGTAGGVEDGAITFELCRELVDDYVLLAEEEIAASLRTFIEKEEMTIEGSAAVAIAGFLKQSERWAGKQVVIVLCGGNISPEILASVR
jgi:threonine dehydratase